MSEAAAAGVLPHVLLDYTHREIYAALKGAVLRTVRERKGSLWAAWQTANFTRAKKLPDLTPLLRKLDPIPVRMTSKEIRGVIFGMARAMNAKITRKPKKG